MDPRTPTSDPVSDFIWAACVPSGPGSGGSHSSGTLELANTLLAANPSIAGSNIYTAALLGDDAAVRNFIALDKANATAKGGPREWDALTYLCFSKYLRLDPDRSAGLLRSAEALLDAGADPNTGWFEQPQQHGPEWESVIYGAAGVAHHAGMTRLLLARGADPNDGETPYHTPESYDNDALKALVESGKLTDVSLATLLLRKADWHDYEGIRYLLENGADPNRSTIWKFTALHQVLRRDNGLDNVAAMLDHGADPTLINGSDHRSGISIAARRGRRDVLELFQQRKVPLLLKGVERLIAACALGDTVTIRSIIADEPALLTELQAEGGTLLSEFAGTGNTEGVAHLLDLGVPVTALYAWGDGYFGIARNSTALHVAAWRAAHAVVRLLIEHGAPVDVKDGNGHTPLYMAIQACTNSYWMSRRKPDSIKALLDAGASTEGIPIPTGYAEADALLSQ